MKNKVSIATFLILVILIVLGILVAFQPQNASSPGEIVVVSSDENSLWYSSQMSQGSDLSESSITAFEKDFGE